MSYMRLKDRVASGRSFYHISFPRIPSCRSLSVPHAMCFFNVQVALDDPRVASGMPVYLYRLTVTGLRHNTIYKVGQIPSLTTWN